MKHSEKPLCLMENLGNTKQGVITKRKLQGIRLGENEMAKRKY